MALSELRKQQNAESLGSTVKNARNKQGYTQKALAQELGLEYYTMVSQMELGYMSIPPSLWVPIAQTLGMDTEPFVLRCLNEYQPELFKALFRNRSTSEAADVLKLLHKGALEEILAD